MGISNLDILGDEDFKLSYDAPGFPLDKDVYPEGLRLDQKRSILRSIISRERKSSNLNVVWKSQGWNRLLWKIKQKIADKVWSGKLSFNQDLQRHRFLVCGKYGESQEDKDRNKRLLVYHCNQMKRCPVCSKRYHTGRSYERGKIAAAVMQANNIKHLRKFNLTLPDFLWNQIKDTDDMRVFVKLANKMLQEFYGCPMKGVHGYESGSVGIHIQVHWYSSEEAWRKKPHLHCYVIPIKLEHGHVKNVDRFISNADLKRLKAAWSVAVKQACVKLGYRRIDEIPDELVIFHDYIDLPKNLEKNGRPGFNFRYDQRSPVEDLEDSVVAMDFNQELLIMAFNQSGYDYYAIWLFDDYAVEILRRLSLKGTNSTYGWLRRFTYYADTLGVEVKKEKDPFDPVPELSVPTEYWREYKGQYNKKKRQVEQVKIVYVRSLKDPNNPGPWCKIDPRIVHGEEIWIGSKKRYLYGVARGKRSP